MVDSPAMTDLSGTNPTSISVGVWAVSTFFAGLAGVLAAPIVGLRTQGNFTILIAASFAAVVADRGSGTSRSRWVWHFSWASLPP